MTGQNDAAAERSALHVHHEPAGSGSLVEVEPGIWRFASIAQAEAERDAAMAEVLRLRTELADALEWKRAVEDAMIVWEMLPIPGEEPRKALHRLICTEQRIALDPAVSKDAAALVISGAERERVKRERRLKAKYHAALPVFVSDPGAQHWPLTSLSAARECAERARAEEREACAQVVQERARRERELHDATPEHVRHLWGHDKGADVLFQAAGAIREREQEGEE